jgi:hypothetical protein
LTHAIAALAQGDDAWLLLLKFPLMAGAAVLAAIAALHVAGNRSSSSRRMLKP